MIKKTITALVAMLAVVLLGASACQSDITPGGACDQQGAQHTNSNGRSYTCKQVEGINPNRNRVWQDDQPLTTDRP